jgi:hypothetical protein
MSDTKYGKYIIYQPKPAKVAQKIQQAKDKGIWTPDMKTIPTAYVDDEYVKGAFYTECVLVPKGGGDPKKSIAPGPHYHEDFEEIIGLFGTDPSDPFELHGQVDLTLGDEVHSITKSCLVVIPRMLVHCPILYTRVDHPIITFTVAPVLNYTKVEV